VTRSSQIFAALRISQSRDCVDLFNICRTYFIGIFTMILLAQLIVRIRSIW